MATAHKPVEVYWGEAGAGSAAELAAFAAMAFDPGYREAWNEAQTAALLEGVAGWAVTGRDTGGGLLAFALCRIVIDEVELLLCTTHPDCRRQGIGTQMMEQVWQSALLRGCRHLFLEVRDGNLAALSLYRAAGFTISGRRPGYYTTGGGERIDALTLHRHLETV